MAKKNKFYMVDDKENFEGYVNIVIAKTSREAKVLGAYTEATECLENWTDLRATAIRGGQSLWTEKEDGSKVWINVVGKGYVYTDLKPQVDSVWELFVKELKKQNRYEEEKDE